MKTYFFKSSAVKVFPSSYRGSYTVGGGEENKVILSQYFDEDHSFSQYGPSNVHQQYEVKLLS